MMFVLPSKFIRPFTSLFAAGLCVAVGLASTACKSGYPSSSKNAPDAKEARSVKTATVTDLPMEQAVTVTGTLAAQDQATVSAKVPGRVQSITVDLGSVVRKGQLLAQLEQ